MKVPKDARDILRRLWEVTYLTGPDVKTILLFTPEEATTSFALDDASAIIKRLCGPDAEVTGIHRKGQVAIGERTARGIADELAAQGG